MRNGLTVTITIVLGCVTGWCGTPAHAQTDAFFARHIWTGDGEPIADAVLVVVGGKVSALGPRDSVQIPPEATRHELGNQVIIPGLVIAQTSLVGTNDVDRTLTPEIQAIDGFDFYADHEPLLAGGITSAQIAPGGDRVMPGMGAVVKLAGDDVAARTLLKRESLRIALDESTRNAPAIYEPPVGPVSIDRPLEPTRPQMTRTLASAFSGLRLVFRNATADRQYVSIEPEIVVQSVAAHLARGGTVRFTAIQPPEIRGALELARHYGLRTLLCDCRELKPFVDEFSAWRPMVRGIILAGLSPGQITNPDVDVASKESLPWEFARELVDAGLPVAIHPTDDEDLAEIMFVAGQFMQGELKRSEVLSMLTLWPARMLGVDDRVGSLATGKDADFVVLDNDPFQLRTSVTETWVGGNRVYESPSASSTTVIRAARVYTGTGEVLSNGALVVKGNTVRGIGTDVSAPDHAQVKDFGDAVIVPGFVDLGTSLGIGGTLEGRVSLDTRLGDALYADDPAIELARNSGVTSVLLGSLNNDGPTPLVAFKLGDNTRVIADPVAIRFRIGDNPGAAVSSITSALEDGKAYADSWTQYEKDLAEYEAAQAAEAAKQEETDSAEDAEANESDKENDGDEDSGEASEDESGDGEVESERPGTGQRRGREGFRGRRPGTRDPEQRRGRPQPGDDEEESEDDQADSEKGQPDEADEDQTDDAETDEEETDDEAPKPPELKEDMEPYRALFAGEIPAFVEARRGDSIKAALQVFCDKYKLQTVLVGADDLARLPDLLNGYEVAVCVGPQHLVDVKQLTVNIPQLLANEQIPFGFQSGGTTGVAQLPRAVQFSVHQGLGVNDGLQALTSHPARLLSSSLNFGSLEAGRDADLVVLSGPPFEHASKVIAVMIDGTWVYERGDHE